jgi:hypothetical protein
MTAHDLKYTVFWDGRNLFSAAVQDKSRFLSITPLEAAYYWALSCHGAVKKVIKFGQLEFALPCKRLVAGRLFTARTCEGSFEFENVVLKPDTVYYVDEDKDGKSSHSLCNLFFQTVDKKLVAVDITGSGSEEKVREKVRNLANWVAWAKAQQLTSAGKKNLKQFKKCGFYGVVLAPGLDILPADIDAGGTVKHQGVIAVVGEDAVSLLGGLESVAQFYGRLKCD